MINVNEALRYLSRYDIAEQDRTTLGHLRTWLTESIAQHQHWAELTRGHDAEIEAELATELETLRGGLARVEERIAA